MHSATSTWKEFFSDIDLPADQAKIWAALHAPNVIDSAIAQTAVKCRKLGGKMDLDYRVRFASSIMNRLDREATASSVKAGSSVVLLDDDNRGNRL